jgi:hypothetical protein
LVLLLLLLLVTSIIIIITATITSIVMHVLFFFKAFLGGSYPRINSFESTGACEWKSVAHISRLAEWCVRTALMVGVIWVTQLQVAGWLLNSCWLLLTDVKDGSMTASLSHKVLFSPCSCLGTRPSLSKPDHSKFRKIEKGNPLTAPRREEQFADSIMASISQVARRTSNSTASARGNGPDWGQHIQLPWCHGSKCSPQAQLKTLEKKETCFYVHIRS